MTDQLVQRLEVAVARLEALTSQPPNIAPKPLFNNASGCYF